MSVEDTQPLITHLIELRKRLLNCIIAVIVIFLCLVYFANDIYHLVSAPLIKQLPQGSTMIATDVASPFFTPIKLTFMVSLILSAPVILYQVWAFIAPALYKHERRLVVPLLVSSSLLFYIGMAFAYFVVFPLAFGFLANTAPEGVQVSTDIAIPLEYYTDVLKRQAVVNPGVTFVLRNQAGSTFEETEFRYENGIQDYVAELAGDTALTTPVFFSTERTGRDRADKDDYRVKISVALCFSNTVNVIEHYHNSSWLEHGGSPEKAMRSALLSAIDGYLRTSNKYNKNESKITWADIQDCLIFVSSNFSTQTSYENQTKKSITNKFVQEAMADFLKEQLAVYFIETPTDAVKIAEQVLINKRSREHAESQRVTIKKKLSGSLDLSNRVAKFVDCRTKDTSLRELYIVEGDSAMGAVKQSRDAEFQGIMPVRGKILNCLKADYNKIFKSEIITDLIKVMGCGVELKGVKKSKDLADFDINNLRWNKIVICTDADVDGYQIRTLILTMLYRLTPTLIEEGYVYIAESPLYEITYRDDTWYAYSNKEKDDIVNGELAGKKCSIQRSKGLGENEPDMMWLTTMNPATRRLIKVMPMDAEKTAQTFDLLLGDNLQGRKDHIAEDGHLFLELADIS